MKKNVINVIVAAVMSAVLAVSPIVESAANINLISVSASAATTCHRFSITQQEYNQYISNWNNKGVSYLGRDLYPGAAKKKAVKDMQTLLNKVLGCNLTVDGLFGEGTRAKVLEFQRATGLYADGLFGNASFNMIMKYADIKSESASISFNSMIVPENISEGNSFNLGGNISSTKPLSYVKGEIVNSNGGVVCSRTVNTSLYSLNIKTSAINTYLRFGVLSAGSYTLKYRAAANDGTVKDVSYAFNVTAKPSSAASNNSALSFSSALSYAKNYWNKLDPSNGFYDINGNKTYDSAKFSTGNGNNCANYVSAILLASGLPMDSTWKRGSSAWVNVNSMRNYFVNTKGIKYISYPSSVQIDAGDILYTSSGHVMFVTSAAWSGSQKIIRATGNTNSRDVNFQVTSFYGVIKTSSLF